jgi:uncharacterized protein
MRMGLRKVLLVTAGVLCLIVGAIGILVPVLPTTPFVLVAAGCFANSSPKFYHWLNHNRVFGPFIKHYREGTGVPKAQKTWTLSILWLGLVISAIAVHRPLVYGILAAVGAAVTWHILSMRQRSVSIEPVEQIA